MRRCQLARLGFFALLAAIIVPMFLVRVYAEGMPGEDRVLVIELVLFSIGVMVVALGAIALVIVVVIALAKLWVAGFG